MSHYDEMTCLMYLEGQLERPKALELSAHAETCPECRDLLSALEAESRLLSSSLTEEDEAVPARLLAPGAFGARRKGTPWAWIISFGLATAGAYTLWTGFERIQQPFNEAGFGSGNLLTTLLFGGVFWKGWGDMVNLIEYVAIATLGILAFALLRRRLRRWTPLAVVMSTLALLFAAPAPATAADVKHTTSYTLPRDSVIHNDLIVAAPSVRIDGTVEGDLIVFSQNLTMNGHVTGDVIGFSGMTRIHGQVDGNLRLFVNSLALSGTVAKNASIFGGSVELDSDTKINGGLIAFIGNGTLDGTLGRDLYGAIGRCIINGKIGGAVELKADHLSVGPTAEIAGKFKLRSPRQAEVDSAAKLLSGPIEFTLVTSRPEYTNPTFYLHQVFKWCAGFLFGLVLILAFPRFTGNTTRAAGDFLFSGLLGVASLVGVPFAAIIACITVVGLAVGIGLVLLYVIALYASHVFVGSWIGGKILGNPTGTGGSLGRLALGLLILRVAFQLPYVGGWIAFLVILWGLGALTLSLIRRAQPEAPAPVAAAVAA